jgi:hypothetical protein
MTISIYSQEGERIRDRERIRILVPMTMSFLFVLSALSLSGFVSAKSPHVLVPQGTCKFETKIVYGGQNLYVDISGSGGADGHKAYFQLLLLNRTYTTVNASQEYWVTQFSDVVMFTADHGVGNYTAELTYSFLNGKGHITTRTMAWDGAYVLPGPPP